MFSPENLVGEFQGTPAYEVHTEPRIIQTIHARTVSETQQADNYLTSDIVFLVKDAQGTQEMGHHVFGLQVINTELELAARCSTRERALQREMDHAPPLTPRKRNIEETRSEQEPAQVQRLLPFSDDHDCVISLLRSLGTIFIDRATVPGYHRPTVGLINKKIIPLSVQLYGEQRYMRNLWHGAPRSGDSLFLVLKRTKEHLSHGFMDSRGRQLTDQPTSTAPLQITAVSRLDGTRVLHCQSASGVPSDDDFDYLEDNKRFKVFSAEKRKKIGGRDFIDFSNLGKRDKHFILDGYYEMGSPLMEFKCIRYAHQESSAGGRAFIRRSNAIAEADQSKLDCLTNVNAIATCF